MRSLEMSLINCNVELKLKCTKNCFLATGGNDNNDPNSNNNVTFTNKDKKLCIPVITLAAKGNQKLSKFLSK